MSCKTTSKEEFANTIPVNPPKVKRKTKPKAQSIAGENFNILPFIVESHLKIFTPVGTAITIVADVK